MAFSKNTYYRFLNEPRYNWQRFLTLLSARVVAYFSSLTHRERVKCLVLDDSSSDHLVGNMVVDPGKQLHLAAAVPFYYGIVLRKVPIL